VCVWTNAFLSRIIHLQHFISKDQFDWIISKTVLRITFFFSRNKPKRDFWRFLELFHTFGRVLVFGPLHVCARMNSTEGNVERAYSDDYDYDIDRQSSIQSISDASSSSSSSSSAADADSVMQWRRQRESTWRWCYICSGKSPDRQCELSPQRVTLGPAKVNCTKSFCTAYIRYKAKDYLIERDRTGRQSGIGLYGGTEKGWPEAGRPENDRPNVNVLKVWNCYVPCMGWTPVVGIAIKSIHAPQVGASNHIWDMSHWRFFPHLLRDISPTA